MGQFLASPPLNRLRGRSSRMAPFPVHPFNSLVFELNCSVLSMMSYLFVGKWLPLLIGVVETSDASSLNRLNLLQALILGVVQGLTEFLPISSTAHVKIVPVLLGWGDPGVAFTAIIQLGSIAAILSYFWADLRELMLNMAEAASESRFDSADFRVGLGILIGTLPIVFFGGLIKLFLPNFDQSPLRSSAAIAIASIVMGIFLGISEILGKRKRGFDGLGLFDGIGMGAAQALALIPGVSRAGSTLTAGLFMGLDRATAARFSFLMGIPAITLAGLVELKGFLDAQANYIGLIPMIGGLVSALISSYIVIVWLLRFLKNHSTWVFVWYRLGFGASILFAIAANVLQNV
ncbi:MAG: undecaprenyl-diphosphate phosphatase [Leptolyngbyaceae cyanobacterium MO_188.B28]|nr:undecaprenyl-diphosphate phosphatase [Leptolyngbyaceae cyanobacterium MO_188.B28]